MICYLSIAIIAAVMHHLDKPKFWPYTMLAVAGVVVCCTAIEMSGL